MRLRTQKTYGSLVPPTNLMSVLCSPGLGPQCAGAHGRKERSPRTLYQPYAGDQLFLGNSTSATNVSFSFGWVAEIVLGRCSPPVEPRHPFAPAFAALC